MAVLSLPGTWVNDVDVPLSAADLNMYRDAAILLDGLTFRRMSVGCSNGPQLTDGNTASFHSAGDYRQSWWAIYFRTGMTSITVEGACATRIDFYLDGVFNTFQAAAPGGFSKGITLSGYSEGDVVLLEVRTNGNPDSTPRVLSDYTGKYIIYSVMATPIVVSSTWPGVPTFAGTYDAARLNQLTDACQYIWDRVVAVPIPAFVGSVYVPGTHKMETIKLFDGGVRRLASNEVLRVGGAIVCRVNAEHYIIAYNGSTAYTSPTYTNGQTATIWQAINLTHTLGTLAEVSISAVNEDNTYGPYPGVFSSFSLSTIRAEADSSGYATQAPPTAFTAEESISAATLNSRLNSLSTMLSTAKARLDARPELWNHANAFRRVFAKDDPQVARNFKRHAATFVRQGDRLIVRGKGVKIGFGAISFKPPAKEDEPINYADFTWAREESVGGQEDKAETAEVMLDSIAGLELGMRYYVYSSGALELAQEMLV